MGYCLDFCFAAIQGSWPSERKRECCPWPRYSVSVNMTLQAATESDLQREEYQNDNFSRGRSGKQSRVACSKFQKLRIAAPYDWHNIIYMFNDAGLAQSVVVVVRLRTLGIFRLPAGKRHLSSPDRYWGPLNLLFSGYQGIFPLG